MSLATDLVSQINEARKARQIVAMITFIKTGEKLILHPGKFANVDGDLLVECEARLQSGKSGLVTTEDGTVVFINIYEPRPRLIIVGAVHISQALAPMAHTANFDVIVIDPRSSFATPDRFVGVCLKAHWPDDVVPEIGLDAYTALAAVTHDPKIDDSSIIMALKAGCFYVGALGSRNTHRQRFGRLRDAGLSEECLSHIHAPIGLDIGAASPEEISVAILAEVILTLRGPRRSRSCPE